jgi:hypothetical protein
VRAEPAADREVTASNFVDSDTELYEAEYELNDQKYIKKGNSNHYLNEVKKKAASHTLGLKR